MNIFKNSETSSWEKLTKRPEFQKLDLVKTIEYIFNEIKNNGDKALKKFTKEFDKVDLNDFEINLAEISLDKIEISDELKLAIQLAKSNIEKFHFSQKEEIKIIETQPGIQCWRESRAIEKVGLYIPGGTAQLFSTVLMLAIPAKIAGCKEIILCTPPNKEGKIHPAILYASKLCGITKIFTIGGAQAIASMTFGTETVPKTYKIFGPGNQFVTMAKQKAQEFGVAIDLPAGPSEVLVIADETAIPSFCASDLLSQAEHGEDSQVIFLTTDENILEKTIDELKNQLEKLPRKDLAKKAIENSNFIKFNSLEKCFEFSNYYAPEHLILAINSARKHSNLIENAGSVFLGNYSCESAGDYASGTNHTLPTNGFAKSYSGVSLDSFLKKITFQELSFEGLKNIGKSIEIMAETEGLYAHKNAVTIRLSSEKIS